MLKKRLKIIAIAIFILMAAGGGVFFYGYNSWLKRVTADATKGSQTVETEFGIIEYNTLGDKDDPVLLLFHGGGTGSNMLYMYEDVARQGYYLICASRSGVKGTPYDPKASFAKSADMSAALLEKLGITGKVNVLGVSLGGPPALQFAMRFPDRTHTLIMMDAVSQKYIIPQAHQDSFIGRIFMSGHGLDYFGYLQYLQSEYDLVDVLENWLGVVTTYDENACGQISKELSENPRDRSTFRLFLKITSPMSLYYKGMMQECGQARNLPTYPLDTIRAPTLVTHSRMDGDVAFADGEYTAKMIPGAELYAFDGNGHLFFLGPEWPLIQIRLLNFLASHNQLAR